jgi:hypothetical protein
MVDNYDAARKVKVFARDLVSAMEREVARRSLVDGRDGFASAAKMVYSRAESFLYFEFPRDVYEQVREEFKTEIEDWRAMRAREERLERQNEKEFQRAQEKHRRQAEEEWRRLEERRRRQAEERIRRGIESIVLDRRENSAPPGKPKYKSELLSLYRLVQKRGRIGHIAGWHLSYLSRKYAEEYRELVAERAVHHQTKRAVRLALARNQISQESYTAVLAGEITLQRAKKLGPNRTPDGLQKPSKPPKRTPRLCLCGCGGTTRGGCFLPGHQARVVAIVRRRLRADPVLAGLTEEQRAYARERNLIGWRGVPGALL